MALPTGKRIAFAAAAAVISIALSLAAAEGVLRLRYETIAQITGVTEWQTAQFQGLTYHWDQYHPRYGWTNRPGYRSDASLPFQVAINEQGLRGTRELAPHPQPGIRRIAFFGDSLAFGEDVGDAQTVPHYLEERLADSQVLNFGVHGYGLGQMALRLEDEAFALHPDHLVVMLMVPRDLFRDLKRHFVHAKPVFGVRDGELTIGNLPVPTASQQPWLHRHSFTAAFLFARATAEAPAADPGLPIQVGQQLLRRMRTRAAAEGIPLTLVNVSNALDLHRLRAAPEERAQLDALRAALALPELDVLDLIDFLDERMLAEGPSLATASWHWSARANCLIAAEIANHFDRVDPAWSVPRDVATCPSLRPGPRSGIDLGAMESSDPAMLRP